MGSFHAELYLAGNCYRVVRCSYACHQPTSARGRASAKVRHNLLHLTVDVPEGDELLAWAATPHKPLAGEVVCYDATQLVAHETIAFTAGECVGYHEHFESGAGGNGAYVCQLTITAPAFELRGGGPAAAVATVAAAATGRTIGGSGAAGNPAGGPPPTKEHGQLPGTDARRFKSDSSSPEDNASQAGAFHALTNATALASLGTTLQALDQLLAVRHADLTRWDDPAKAYFQQAFGSTTDSARDTMLGRITRMQSLLSAYQTDKAYQRCFVEVDDDDEPGSVAFVYPDDTAHQVHLYEQFWQMPATGTDSRPGVLAHEMSHFDDVGPTDDYEYGLEECADLAKNNPSQALHNADSFEYYLEGADFGAYQLPVA